MPRTENQIIGELRLGAAVRNTAAVRMGYGCGGVYACGGLLFEQQEVIMKVILIEKPKFISGILRKLYGIKKEKPDKQ